YVSFHRRRMYWELAQDTNNAVISQAIFRNKFEFILSNIHFQDNNSLDKSDKFAKVRPLFLHLNKKFMKHAYIEEDVWNHIPEYTIFSKGREVYSDRATIRSEIIQHNLYLIAIGGRKWYFTLIAHCVDIAIQNHWQIYRKYGETMDQLSFRRSIANSTLYTYQQGHLSGSNRFELRYDWIDHYVIP
ncbi:hypothetical protein ILUMI_16359, partial [Ignelater luminosus]